MGKWKKRTAAAAIAVGMITAAAPAASAETTAVPCETVFGEYLCAQMQATGKFVSETAANASGAVAEWRKRIADEANEAWQTVYCIASGACPIFTIQP